MAASSVQMKRNSSKMGHVNEFNRKSLQKHLLCSQQAHDMVSWYPVHSSVEYMTESEMGVSKQFQEIRYAFKFYFSVLENRTGLGTKVLSQVKDKSILFKGRVCFFFKNLGQRDYTLPEGELEIFHSSSYTTGFINTQS